MAFPDSFQTPRLAAERLREHHFADLLRMHSDARQMAPLGGVKNEAETRDYLDRNLDHWDQHGFGLWILRDLDGGPVVGRALLRTLTVEGTDEVEVGYSFHPEHWGRGLATEIATTLVILGQEQLGLGSIVAVTQVDNAASQRVLEKAGLEPAGEIAFHGVAHSLFRLRVVDAG
jgi:RimJ/RimL family protein N-acetyltransferase